ncbi:spermidine synthase [Modestobacter marinus]|uniref:spermidine synthase n=1 Tax=Modestobacter marinus TaxID=477641 RepID=UPI001C958066|nr:spermidine synthase [Modestobacter marinus]
MTGGEAPLREELGRAAGTHGEVVLRRCDAHLELVVAGVFAMDDVDTSTERALATEALRRCGGQDLTVLVGGLGLGWTAAAALADPRVTAVEVVELQPPLVGWAEQGLLPALPVADPRLRLHVGDVSVHLAGARARYDAVLLDVDNGPVFLVHPTNAGLYEQPGLAAALGALRPGGVLAIWSSAPVPELAGRLTGLPGAADVEHVVLAVERDRRRHEYALVLARRAAQPS